MIDNSVLIAIISTVGAIATAYLAAKYKDRIVKKPAKDRPMDRMETIFDGYEKLIKQQQIDIDRKSAGMNQLGKIVDRLENELAQTRQLLNIANADLEQSREQNKYLTMQLEAMKAEYAHPTK